MRKTTAYLVRVPVQDDEKPNDLVPALVARVPEGASLEQTATHSGTAGVRFRIPTNDIAAMDIAREIAAGREFSVSTGYGVHQREVGHS